jgi:hypothetical protein
MDKAERLSQFLEWVDARRASSLNAVDLRGIASALLDESGGGRVTESHILTVGDRLGAQGGDHALQMVTECGELFLRFEEWQRQAGQPSAAPRGPLGTMVPRKQLEPIAASSTPSAPLDVAPPLRPPERVPTEGDSVLPPSPVTFTRTTQSSLPLPSPRDTQQVTKPVPASGPVPSAFEVEVRNGERVTSPVDPGTSQPLRTTPAPSAATPAPGARTTGTNSALAHAQTAAMQSQPRLPAPTVRESQRLGGAFRCKHCAVMVIPGEDGNCPKCGNTPPHTLQMPAVSSASPPAVRGKGINWLVPVALLAVGILGSIAGVHWSRTACDQNRGQSVAGEAKIERLGVKAYFPGGWRRHKGTDETEAMPGGTAGKMLGYYRGGTSDDPDVGLMLMVTDAQTLPPGTPEVSDADFQKMVDDAAAGMARNDVQLSPCEITQIGVRRTGRCTGKGRERGEVRQIALYTWMMERRLCIAFFFARAPLAKLLPEADEIVGSIERL